MKIAFVAYDRPGSAAGPIVNARRILTLLKQSGHDPVALIFYHGGRAPTAEALHASGVACQVTPWVGHTPTHVRWLLRQIAAIEPDVFVPNISVAGYFAARWAREAGIPTVAAHRSDDAYHWAMVDQFVTGPPEWAVSGLVCVSEELRRRVAAMEPPRTRLCVIPSGVPLPTSHAPQERPLRLVYAGRLEENQKRIGVVLDRIMHVLRRRPEMTASILGTGSMQAELQRRVAAQQLDDRIRFHGHVEPDRLPEVLMQHHVAVLLSAYEGLPGSLMDAMASGLVPVVTDIPGGTRELVQHERTGLVVPDTDAAFLEAIDRIATDQSLRTTLGAAARQRVRQAFSLDEAARRWEAFCHKLVNEAGPRQPIEAPRRLALPPVRPDLAREDQRGLRGWCRARLSAAWRRATLQPGKDTS